MRSTRDLALRADLYAVGLTPLAAIDVMIEIEREFRIVFPYRILSRQIMASIEKNASCLSEMLADGSHPTASYAEAA